MPVDMTENRVDSRTQVTKWTTCVLKTANREHCGLVPHLGFYHGVLCVIQTWTLRLIDACALRKKSPFRFVTLARLTNTEDRVYWPAQSDQQEMSQLGFHLHRVVKPKLFFCLNVFLVILRHSIVDTQTWQEAGSQNFFCAYFIFPSFFPFFTWQKFMESMSLPWPKAYITESPSTSTHY